MYVWSKLLAKAVVLTIAPILLVACDAASTRAGEAEMPGQEPPAVSRPATEPALDDVQIEQAVLMPVSDVVSPEITAQWGQMARLANAYWVLNDQGTAQYLAFTWEEAGEALAFSGMDRDGNAIAGQYVIEPASRQVVGLTVYRGHAYELTVEQRADGFVVFSEVAGERTRTTYSASGANAFRITQEAYRRNEWRPIRSQNLIRASRQLVQTLGWRPRTAEIEAAEAEARAELFERRPSFFSRVANAFQDGTVAGVEEGTRDGISTVTRRAITGDDEPEDDDYVGSDSEVDPGNTEPEEPDYGGEP